MKVYLVYTEWHHADGDNGKLVIDVTATYEKAVKTRDKELREAKRHYTCTGCIEMKIDGEDGTMLFNLFNEQDSVWIEEREVREDKSTKN